MSSNTYPESLFGTTFPDTGETIEERRAYLDALAAAVIQNSTTHYTDEATGQQQVGYTD
jgi:hypothetical protein